MSTWSPLSPRALGGHHPNRLSEEHPGVLVRFGDPASWFSSMCLHQHPPHWGILTEAEEEEEGCFPKWGKGFMMPPNHRVKHNRNPGPVLPKHNRRRGLIPRAGVRWVN